jgi:uracil-DNA glycosylase
VIRPSVVATLGGVALEALSLIAYHEFRLKDHTGLQLEWNGVTLVPLYHPSPQVVASQRGLDLQLRNFQTLGSLIK